MLLSRGRRCEQLLVGRVDRACLLELVEVSLVHFPDVVAQRGHAQRFGLEQSDQPGDVDQRDLHFTGTSCLLHRFRCETGRGEEDALSRRNVQRRRATK